MAAKETVLYYQPEKERLAGNVSKAAKLKGVLIRMGVRIKNIAPEQTGQTVGYLAGFDGFGERAFGEGAFGERAFGERAFGEGAFGEGTPGEGTPGEGALGEEAPGEGAPGEGARGEGTRGEGTPGEGTSETGTVSPVIEDEMLVMKNFTNRRIDELLTALRRAGVPKIELKAVITETNCGWTFYALYKELKKEREAMEKRDEA